MPPTVSQADLQAFADNLQVSPAGPLTPAVGQAVQVSALVDNHPTVTGTQAADLLLHGVTFPSVTDDTVTGPLTLVGVTGDPGFIGHMNLPVAVPVTVAVQWKITTDSAGNNPLPADQFSAPGGLTGYVLNVLFAPQIVLVGSSPATSSVFITAEITVQAGALSATPANPPVVEVQLPSIPLPQLVALYRWANFAATLNGQDGYVLLLVPNSSPVSDNYAQLLQSLDTLAGQLSTLSAIASMAALGTGLAMLASTALSQVNIVMEHTPIIRGTDGIDDTGHVQTSFPWWDPFGWNHMSAGDSIRSMILIGPVGTKFHCFNDFNWNTDQGDFTLATGVAAVAFVKDLGSASPASGPLGNEITVIDPPTGQRWFLHKITTFADEISSVKWEDTSAG